MTITINAMEKKEIEKLMHEHGSPCITVVVPAHHISNDRKIDPQTLMNAINTAKEILNKNGENTLPDIMNKLDSAVEQVDYLHTVNGVGIYVSPSIFQI